MIRLPLVAICVPTYKRPEFLRDLLESMGSIVLDGFQAHLIVVDNDVSKTALPIVEGLAHRLPMPVSYVVESTRGFASARNRLVMEANGLAADYVAFVDDDQIVEPTWLRELVGVAESYQCDAVMGNWLPRFEDGVPDWVKQSGYFRGRPQRPTGVPLEFLSTGNVLIKLDSLLQIPGPFDERSNLSGGEDTLLSIRFRSRGFRIVWCDQSIVYERITASRATARWMINRSFCSGLILGELVRSEDGSLRSIILRATRATALVTKGLILVGFSARRGRAGAIPRVADTARGLGVLVGLAGFGDAMRD